MTREKSQFDVLARIERERTRRRWTEYTLAKNSGIAQSTISTWYCRQLQPSIASIEKICRGLGITLSEFFEDDTQKPGGEAADGMTADQRELYESWARLSPVQKKALVSLIKSFDLD